MPSSALGGRSDALNFGSDAYPKTSGLVYVPGSTFLIALHEAGHLHDPVRSAVQIRFCSTRNWG